MRRNHDFDALHEAIDELEEPLDKERDIADLSERLDAVASELGRTPHFSRWTNPEDEPLDTLLEYAREEELADTAEELYDDANSVEYDLGEVDLETVREALEALVEGLRELAERKSAKLRKPSRRKPKKRERTLKIRREMEKEREFELDDD